jgi:hypothetical protein
MARVRGKKPIVKKDKKIWFDPEKSGRRRGKDRFFINPEKKQTDLWF